MNRQDHLTKRPAARPAPAIATSKRRKAIQNLQRIVAENAPKGIGFGTIKDPTAWQRKQRQDRPLPGRS